MKLLRRIFGGEYVETLPVRTEALVVEDQQEEADLLCTLLRQHQVITYHSKLITGALELLNSNKVFQLAFVDLTLPDGSGFEVIRMIKERRRSCHVIIVSGDIGKIPLALGWGYVGVLGKPYTVNSVDEILYKHRLPRAY